MANRNSLAVPTPPSRKCLRCLYTSDYESHKDRNPKRVDGTLEWFLRHENLLWVTADPGCGKTMLAAFLVDELSVHSEPRDTITTTRARNLQNNSVTLWRIFRAATTDPDCGNVICIIDALDECEESTRKSLIDSLVSSYTPAIGTGRSTGETLPKFILTTEEQTPAISEDIERVIDSEVELLGNVWHLTDDDRIIIRDKLIRGADHTFLWVSLIVKILHGSQAASRRKFLQTLNSLPSNLESVYEKILEDICDREEAKRILQIVVAATRPLTLDEMDIAQAIQRDHKSIEDLQPCRLYSFESTVKNTCGLFVKVIDSKIYLIHQTAKEFLIKGTATATSATEITTWKQSLCPIESNLTLAKSCLYFLLFNVFETHPLALRAQGSDIDGYTIGHVFLDYAAKNWTAHVQEAKIWEDEKLSAIALKVYTIYMASNLASYIEQGEDVNSGRSLYNNALNVAVRKRNRNVIMLLLNRGAIVFLFGSEYWNLLEVNRCLSLSMTETRANSLLISCHSL
ncbi:hypothetical protein BZA05DRAFT_427763 [Tricharina praecox]|uniref:uncharacterized protein n=1 Tax=Tricharina praecox TaxID=43433 RepID=UPI00221F72B3|nr:uncharacterized protein BZA05DRAFT_427763 [Tricharina praecox]KAI5840896.1 hypothetical protein BZA05DRAFT_427763 [Tricharina praecox]